MGAKFFDNPFEHADCQVRFVKRTGAAYWFKDAEGNDVVLNADAVDFRAGSFAVQCLFTTPESQAWLREHFPDDPALG